MWNPICMLKPSRNLTSLTRSCRSYSRRGCELRFKVAYAENNFPRFPELRRAIYYSYAKGSRLPRNASWRGWRGGKKGERNFFFPSWIIKNWLCIYDATEFAPFPRSHAGSDKLPWRHNRDVTVITHSFQHILSMSQGDRLGELFLRRNSSAGIPVKETSLSNSSVWIEVRFDRVLLYLDKSL